MMFYETCRDYTVITTSPNDVDAPGLCRRLEMERADGYAVIASLNGKIVADADGWRDESEGAPPYDAATATGMYDRDF